MPFLYLSYKRRPSWNLKKKTSRWPSTWNLVFRVVSFRKSNKIIVTKQGSPTIRTIIQCAGKFTTVHRIVFTKKYEPHSHFIDAGVCSNVREATMKCPHTCTTCYIKCEHDNDTLNQCIEKRRGCLTHWDLVTSYGDRELGQHWLR